MWRKRKLWASCAISYYFLCIISVKYTSKTEERCCRALILLYQICLSPHHDVAIKDQGRSVSVCIFSSQLWGRISKGSPKHFKCSMWILTLQGLCTAGYLKKKKTCSIDRTSWNWIENWFVHLRCGRKHFCYKGLSVFRGKWYKTAFILLFKISTWIILLYCFHTQLTEFGAWSLWLFKKFLSFSPHCHFLSFYLCWEKQE